MTDPKENFCAVSWEIRPSSASAISAKASYSRPEMVASFSFSRTTPKKSTTAPCSVEKPEGKGSKGSRVTFTPHRCMTAFYAGLAAICKAWIANRPEDLSRRDAMKAARQFIAWNLRDKRPPVGNGVIGGYRCALCPRWTDAPH